MYVCMYVCTRVFVVRRWCWHVCLPRRAPRGLMRLAVSWTWAGRARFALHARGRVSSQAKEAPLPKKKKRVLLSSPRPTSWGNVCIYVFTLPLLTLLLPLPLLPLLLLLLLLSPPAAPVQRHNPNNKTQPNPTPPNNSLTRRR